MAYFLSGGDGFAQPPEVRRAVNAVTDPYFEQYLDDRQRAMDAQLALAGVSAITNVAYPKCPTGPGAWVKVKSSVPECERKLGMRLRTPEGWCYPEGMCALELGTLPDGSIIKDEPALKQLTTLRKMEILGMYQAMLNSARQVKRDQWLQAKAAELKGRGKKMVLVPSERSTDGVWVNKKDDKGVDLPAVEMDIPPYTQMGPAARQGFQDAVADQIPVDLKALPTMSILKTQEALEKTLRENAKARAPAGVTADRLAKLKSAMEAANVLPPLGTDMDAYVKTYYDEAAKCADASIGHTYREAEEMCPTAECSFFEKAGPERAMCMPKSVLATADPAWSKGEPDVMGAWWQDMFAERAQEYGEQVQKIARAMGAPAAGAGAARRRVW